MPLIKLRNLSPVQVTCRDESHVLEEQPPQAMAILWGKFFPVDALGPRCEDCLFRHVPQLSWTTISQWAIFDLRNLHREEPD